jgi:hypothetical protein
MPHCCAASGEQLLRDDLALRHTDDHAIEFMHIFIQAEPPEADFIVVPTPSLQYWEPLRSWH